MPTDLEIDLEDGLPPIKQETTTRTKSNTSTPIRFKAPEQIQVTRTPIGLVISVAPIRCLGCGAEHHDHRGIFVESKLSNGVLELKRTEMRGLGNYANLPRRVDVAPEEVVPICYDCFLVERSFRDAVAVAAAEGGEPFGSPDHPKPIADIAITLHRIHSDGILEDQL